MSETVHTSFEHPDNQASPGNPARAEAGERTRSLSGGSRYAAVLGIEPVDGWVLCHCDPNGDTGSRWAPKEYCAVNGSRVLFLGVSRWFFTPTQDRFAWLVRNNFPMAIRREPGVMCPLDNRDIDLAISAENLRGVTA